MNLPNLTSLRFSGKRVLLRLDLDIPFDFTQGKSQSEDRRLEASVSTIKYLLEHKAKQIIILGHRGRPEGVKDESLSLRSIGLRLLEILKEKLGKFDEEAFLLEENLRFDPRESFDSAQDYKRMMDFAKELAKKGDVYVNDAFGTSHRESASIVGLPKLLPHAAGLHLEEEVRNLEKVLENPQNPVVFIVSGGKPDKALLVEKLLDHAEFVLVGGIIAKHIKSYCREKDGRMCIVAAHLTHGGKEITPDSAQNFVKIIETAGTIVWNGPLGDIDNGYWDSTEMIAKAIVESRAFRVIGGGDTIRALEKLNLLDKMDYVSTGGGAMLEFLAYGDLPGLTALREK